MNKSNQIHMEMTPRNSKRLSPKVDLTAMVDLGFLLITFFMLASAFVKPKVMEIKKPHDGDTIDTPLSKTMTLVIGKGDELFGYVLPDVIEKMEDAKIDTLTYAVESLRKYIQVRQDEVRIKHGHANELFVIIKPAENSAYLRLIDILDEMLITNVERYAIMKPNTKIDSLLLH